MEQKILVADTGYSVLDRHFSESGIKKILLVCGKSFSSLKIQEYFANIERRLGIKIVQFSNFNPNPQYESVVSGVKAFLQNQCDAIVAVGGGSAIDVAKCIKLYSNLDQKGNYLTQPIVPQNIPLFAVPTTAGSGSEATRYAVIYYMGEKQSVSHESCIPDTVLLDASGLEKLPDYHKKSSMLDALCHAIESFWSINATPESMACSKIAIQQIFDAKDRYLLGDNKENIRMLMAANTAGKAINIAQTTAGHAMCYKLIGLYGIAHGHAAALCVSELMKYIAQNIDKCIDPRGQDHLEHVLAEIACAMNCATIEEAADKFKNIMDTMDLKSPKPEHRDWEILKTSVNQVRLKNNPVRLRTDEIDMLYHKILAS